MKTFIIPWLPDETEYTLEDLKRDLPNPDYGDFFWKGDGLEEARSGDNFLLVYYGLYTGCVVMKGFFLEDGSSYGKKTALRPIYIALPEGNGPRLRWDSIIDRFPRLEEEGFFSAHPLFGDEPARMEELWQEYLSGLDEDFFDGMQAEHSRRPAARIDDAISIASEALYDKKDPIDGTPAILSTLNVALSFRKEDEMIAAALRDVIGQDGWTPGRLRERGFSERIVDTLVLLHRDFK